MGAVAPYAALIITHLSVVSSRQRCLLEMTAEIQRIIISASTFRGEQFIEKSL